MPWQFFRTPTLSGPVVDRLEPARETIDLRQMLRAMCETHGPILAHWGVGLDLFLPDDPLTVTLMPDDLRQLIVHIIDLAASVLQRDMRLHVLARAEGRHAVINWRDASAGTPLLARAFDTGTGSARASMPHPRHLATTALP